MTTLLTVWAWLKKHWRLLALIVSAIAGALLFRQRETSFADDMKAINDAHAKELQDIQAARDEERKQVEANQKQLEATLAAVQQKYDEQQKELDDKKKAEVEQIVKDHGDDPDELAKQLSAATGFQIILPKDQ